MAREQMELDVRSPRESTRDEAYTSLSESYDEVRELVEQVGAAVDYGDEETLAAAVAACAAWWRRQ